MLVRYFHAIDAGMVCPKTVEEIMSCIVEHDKETMYFARVILT